MKASSKVNTDNYITLIKAEKGLIIKAKLLMVVLYLVEKVVHKTLMQVDVTIDGRKLQESEYEKIPGGIKLNISCR